MGVCRHACKQPNDDEWNHCISSLTPYMKQMESSAARKSEKKTLLLLLNFCNFSFAFFPARCCSHRCFGVSEVEMNSIVGWFLVWNWKLHRNDSLCYSTSTKTLTHKHTTTGAARRSALKWAKKWVLFENGGKEENFIVLARKWKRVHEIRLDGLEF